MKILFVSTSSGSQGGGELCLISLGAALVRRGHEVTLWTSEHPKMNPLSERFSEFGRVIRSDYTNTYDRRLRSLHHILPLPGSYAHLIEDWKQAGPDIIHLNKQNLEDGLDLLGLLGESSLPSIAFLHITQSARYLEARFARIRDFAARRKLNAFPGPIVTTKNRAGQLKDFLGTSKDVVGIDNGVDVPAENEYLRARQACRDELGIPDDVVLIGGIGRLEHQKRPLLFCEMARDLHLKIPNSQILWVGAGSLEAECNRWIQEQNLQQVFRRIGWQNNVFPYLAAFDIYLHPAAFEGMPFSLLEAMAWRNPCVVCADLADELKILNDNVSIIASPTEDDAWIERAICADERRKLAAAAQDFIICGYSLDRMAADYENLYRKVLNSSSAPLVGLQ